MFIAGGSREFLGVGCRSEGRGGEGSLASTAGELRGGVGGFVTVKSRSAILLVRVQAMQSTMLILEFGKTQPILQTEGNLGAEKSQLTLTRLCGGIRIQRQAFGP
jgi:hypothetical protein